MMRFERGILIVSIMSSDETVRITIFLDLLARSKATV